MLRKSRRAKRGRTGAESGALGKNRGPLECGFGTSDSGVMFQEGRDEIC